MKTTTELYNKLIEATTCKDIEAIAKDIWNDKEEYGMKTKCDIYKCFTMLLIDRAKRGY